MKRTEFIIPTLDEFILYFLSNGFSRALAERAYKGYEANDWKDSNNKKIVSWKQKCQHVWFKDSNKEPQSKFEKNISHIQRNMTWNK